MREISIRVHEIAVDGYPDTRADENLVGRIAFLFDGCIVSGWPLRVDNNNDASPYSPYWEADTDVGHNRKFVGVTHWVEFPVPVWDIEKGKG